MTVCLFVCLYVWDSLCVCLFVCLSVCSVCICLFPLFVCVCIERACWLSLFHCVFSGQKASGRLKEMLTLLVKSCQGKGLDIHANLNASVTSLL